MDAANCYKKNDPKEAAASLQKVSFLLVKSQMLFVQKQLLQAIDIYTDMGRFTIAAKHHETIAGIFESEVDICIQLQFQLRNCFQSRIFQCADLDKAMQHYEQVERINRFGNYDSM